ncbi:MAG: molybdopterin molybdotransferase MoeA [FCB group bacterium]|nr:molybdopterin molybdotransferase MoeA [FCB group bacterium]
MITVTEARHIIRERIPAPKTESVPLTESSGRILAREITATFPMPRFTNSAMDGFAVRAADTAKATNESPVRLSLIGSVPAGSPADFTIEAGTCAQCMTGAPLPAGADAVVMVEHTSGFNTGKGVEIFSPVTPGQNVRVRGEEIHEGEQLLRPGLKIGPAEMGVMATFGIGTVPVYLQPRIALYATGDELTEPGQPLKPGQIYNSNLYLLADFIRKAGAEVTLQAVIRDDPGALNSFLTEALDTCDLIISSGGVSMGKHDYVRRVLLDLRVEQHFWKVAQKPGKPLFFGSTGETLIFGLPGNPVSLFIGFMEYIWSTIEQWMGCRTSSLVEATLTETFPRESQKVRFLFGKAWIENGEIRCAPSTKRGSHMLTSALQSNCILRSEPADSPLRPGDKIFIRLLPWEPIGESGP